MTDSILSSVGEDPFAEIAAAMNKARESRLGNPHRLNITPNASGQIGEVDVALADLDTATIRQAQAGTIPLPSRASREQRQAEAEAEHAKIRERREAALASEADLKSAVERYRAAYDDLKARLAKSHPVAAEQKRSYSEREYHQSKIQLLESDLAWHRSRLIEVETSISNTSKELDKLRDATAISGAKLSVAVASTAYQDTWGKVSQNWKKKHQNKDLRRQVAKILEEE